MRCTSPLTGYRSRQTSPSGKRAVVFNPKDGFKDMPVTVPCGQCIACRLERSRQWAMRCMHEAQLHEENCFVTLTYADKYLPEYGSLDPEALQKFLKRLRKRYGNRRIRYYGCGEYGDRNGRPHYHICLFGFDFPDKSYLTDRNGYRVWTSEELERLWPYGLCEIGTVTFESAAYVARYFLKKALGDESFKEAAYSVVDADTGEVVQKVPEFARMSRRPGIGKEWFDRYKDEVVRSDSVVVRGVECKPPRFYDGIYELLAPDDMRRIKRRRQAGVDDSENEWERLEAHEKMLKARNNLNPRRM